AALQHVPKPYVYNLFFEMRRLLKPQGFAVVNLLSFRNMELHETLVHWQDEIAMQVHQAEGHWHHFYSRDELEAVLTVGTKFSYVNVADVGGLWFCVSRAPLTLPSDFNERKYLENNPDVAAHGALGSKHWLEYGHREGRTWR